MKNTEKKATSRHNILKNLISQHEIKDQQTLVQIIKEKFGIETNQTTMSRDLRALGISKKKINNKMVYELPDIDASRAILQLAIHTIKHNESLIIIDTLPGLAAFVGDYLDMHKNIGILGVLAGENVLFISPITTKKTKKVFNDICQLVYVKQNNNQKE